jgi:hypothetical protein
MPDFKAVVGKFTVPVGVAEPMRAATTLELTSRSAIPKSKMQALKITFGGGDALVYRTYQA